MKDAMNESGYSRLHFVQKVRESFAFLADEGFTEIEELSTLTRYQDEVIYRNGDIGIVVFHEHYSYELGVDITVAGIRYYLSEILHASNPEAALNYRGTTATTPEVLAAIIDKLSVLMQRYGIAALRSGPHFFSMLEERREQRQEEFALDVLESQLRPQAEDAFRRKDYAKAVELYDSIRARLSPAEIKKLAFAEKRLK